MKIKKVLTLAILLMIPAPAFASCPSGVCAMEINATTGVITYKDATPLEAPPRSEPVIPTHNLNVAASTQGLGISGTPQQLASAVATIAERAVSVPINPCAEGGCTKVEVNVTTKEVTVTPLTMTEVRKKTDQMAQQAIQTAEIAKKASQALPNIQPIDPLVEEVELTLPTDQEPDWWVDFLRALANFYFWYNSVNWWVTL
jgi:hypothetical protein